MMVGTLFVLVGISSLVIAGLMLARMIPPNNYLGVLTRATQANDDAWYLGQRTFAPFLLSVGVILVGAGVLFMLADEVRASGLAAVFILGAGLIAGGWWVSNNSAARSQIKTPESTNITTQQSDSDQSH